MPRLTLNPPRPVNEFVLYDQMGWKPHPGQEKVIRSVARNRVVAAGRRFGKSEIGGHKLGQEAVNTKLVASHLEELGKRREFWIVGPSYTDSEKEFRVLWNELSKLGLRDSFDKPGSYNNPQTGDMHLSLWDGRFQCHAKSEKHPDSLVGEGLSGVVLAEAAKLKATTYNKLIRPTLADYGGWALFTSTPEGKNWFYEMWKRGQDPTRPEWWSMRAPSWMNPYVYPGGATDDAVILLRRMMESKTVITHDVFHQLGLDPEIGELVVDLTTEAFNQEIAALFTEFVGRVFKSFDEELHVGDFTYQRDWITVGAVDYGFTNPNVWLLIQVSPHGDEVRVLDEVYMSGLTAEEFADEILRRDLAPPSLMTFYPDPASPADTKVLEQRLKVKSRGNTGGELKHRIDAIRRALKERNTHLPEGHSDRHPALRFDRKCTSTISDMLNWRYPEKRKDLEGGNSAENPLKKDDHGPEALGRFYAGHFGTGRVRRSRATQSSIGR